MVTNRMQKIDKLIFRELSSELLRLFPDRFFSLTQVHVSKDLSFAKVWVSSRVEPEKLVEEFQSIASDLRKTLAKKVIARRVPSLYFVADLTEEKAEKIDKLISEIEKKDQR